MWDICFSLYLLKIYMVWHDRNCLSSFHQSKNNILNKKRKFQLSSVKTSNWNNGKGIWSLWILTESLLIFCWVKILCAENERKITELESKSSVHYSKLMLGNGKPMDCNLWAHSCSKFYSCDSIILCGLLLIVYATIAWSISQWYSMAHVHVLLWLVCATWSWRWFSMKTLCLASLFA